jgi:signal transduction histidine kinase/ActR/RegA family two-component response regulator
MRGDKDEIGLQQGASFQAKIASIALITTAVVLLTACTAFLAQQYGAERRALSAQNLALATVLAPHVAQELADLEPGEAVKIVRGLVAVQGVRAAYLTDAAGQLLAAESVRGAEADVPPLASDGVSQTRAVLIDQRGQVQGRLIVVSDTGRLTPLLAKYLAVSFALFFAATGMAMFMSKWLAARLIKPVNALSSAMRALAESGDFSSRAPVAGDPIFAGLSESFNALMIRLQANDSALRHTFRELTIARDAAEAANVLKSQFLANMSHEIRTPLNGVLAMAQVMELSKLDPRQRERLSVIRNSGEALLAVLNDVLDLSKIEAGKMELEVADFDAAEVARGVAVGFATTAAKQGLAFMLEVAPAAEGLRRGDPARLRQILNNLVSNAVKFTPEGEVRLTVEGCGYDGAERLLLTVSDTGPGIAPEKLPTLFDKFTQADNSATRRFGGTGLGLAICRELASLMGGRVTVNSQVGRGSTFQVELPYARVADAAPIPSEAPAPPVAEAGERPLRILAAEDNLTNQRVLRAVLETFGVHLTLVSDGRQAVEAWSRGDYDVVLMDIQMPEMDGVEATRAIRAAERAGGRARTPVLALSANAMTHQVSEYLAAGMDAHIAKPIEIPKLQAAIEAALAGPAFSARAA